METGYKYKDDSIDFHYMTEQSPSPNNGGFKVHTHLFNEFYFFIRGKAVFRIEGTSYPLHPGDILIMRHAESHAIEIDLTEPYERLSLHFDPEIIRGIDPKGRLLRAFEDRDIGKKNKFAPSDFKTPLCSMLVGEMMEKTESPRQQIVSLLIAILNELDKAFAVKDDHQSENADSLDKRVIDYINLHLSEDLSLNALCAKFYISKPQLCRIFKSASGSTVWEYITVKRLMAAQKLIRSSTPPTKAAISCGFNDYSVFYRAYRRHFGSSPKQQRQ